MLSLGIDVGLTKGLHLVGLGQKGEILYQSHFTPWCPERFQSLLWELSPQLLCIDAPSGWACEGHKSREAERRLRREYGIQSFYTPSEAQSGSAFYDWVRRGEALFELAGSSATGGTAQQ